MPWGIEAHCGLDTKQSAQASLPGMERRDSISSGERGLLGGGDVMFSLLIDIFDLCNAVNTSISRRQAKAGTCKVHAPGNREGRYSA